MTAGIIGIMEKHIKKTRRTRLATKRINDLRSCFFLFSWI